MTSTAPTSTAPPTGPPSQVATAARGTALNLAGAIIGAIVSFGTVGLITNVYGQAGAGLFFAATAVFTLAANSARLGAESSLTYFVARYRADERHGEITGTIKTALFAAASVAIALGLAGLASASWLSGLLTSEASSADTAATMIRILAISVPTFALSQAMFGAARGFGTMRPSVLVGQIGRPISQLIFVLVVIAISDSVWPLAAAWALSSTVTMVSIGGWLWRRLKLVAERNSDRTLDQGSARSEGRSTYWRYTGPRAVSDLLSASLERSDVLLVAVFIGEAGAGLYGASNRLILAGQLMMIATAQSMAPLLSANFLKREHQDAQSVLRTISGWNVIILWPIFIGLAFGAKTALSVFGSEFSEASSLVVVLACAFLVIIGLGIGDTLLMMTGDSVASLINHAISLAIMVGAAIALLPTVGIVGAAWAWAMSRVALRALSVGRVWYTTRVHAFGPQVITAMAITVGAYVPTGIAVRLTLGESVQAVAVHAIVGVVIQLPLLLRFRERLQLDQLVTVIARR